MIPPHGEFVNDRMQGLPLNLTSHRGSDALMLMPFCRDTDPDPNANYRYDQEVSKPYRYSVFLDDDDISVDFAPAAKAAVYSFTFEGNGTRSIVLRTVGRGEINADGQTISGFENLRNAKHYIYLEFDRTPVKNGSIDAGRRVAACAQFGQEVKTVKARYGISYISVEQAKKNLEKEIKDFDIERVA
jgi:putative alpha-1,2-mannosidase